MTKKPDKEDISLLERTNQFIVSHWYPSDKLPIGYNTTQPQKSHGINVYMIFLQIEHYAV